MAKKFLDNSDWQQIVKDLLLNTHRERSGHLDSTDAYYAVADEDIRQGMPIALIDGEVVHVRRATCADGYVNGLAYRDALQGEQILYVTRGLILCESWETVIGEPRLVGGQKYWLSTTGTLSRAAPDSGYAVCVGHAQSWHMLDVSITQRLKV